MVFRGLLQIELPDRCDDYRGCSIWKRNDPRPTETFDFWCTGSPPLAVELTV